MALSGVASLLRINSRFFFLPKDGSQFRALQTAFHQPGCIWAGKVSCFKTHPLEATLLVRLEVGMVEHEKKHAQETLRRVYDFLFEISHNMELKEFDFKTRSFEWKNDGDTRMICRYQTAEGRIWLAENKFLWNTCVKREGHVGNSNHFIKFVEAVNWVEKQIVNLANKPKEVGTTLPSPP